tara:strand:+ start:989 stop:2386 length:1398 start_codon:yes stop_codon:yes gene_type:complete
MNDLSPHNGHTVTPTDVEELPIAAGALENLAKGTYGLIPDTGRGIVGAVKKVARTLQIKGQKTLKQMVNMSVNLNEAVTNSAAMIRDTREVDNRSQAIAAAAEELVASVNEIARNTEDAAGEAQNARATADQGVDAADRAVAAMERIATAVEGASARVETLAEASSQIGSIVGQINDIAKQTNLLALNATIEAARAGEAGKGFAVVAGEVKNLSNQTSKATEDIRGQIDNLRTEMDGIVSSMQEGAAAVDEGRDVISAAGQEMRTMSHQVIGITQKMEEIAGILSQQTQASNEVAEGITAIAGMTAQNVTQIEGIVDFMAAIDVELMAAMDDRLGEEIPDMTIYRAKSDHIIWKKKLAEMMVGRVRLNPDELADHHSCRLGKWYDSLGDEHIKAHPAYAALLEPHRAVHAHGIEAARKYQAGDLDGAMGEIQMVAESSKDVVRLLDELLDRDGTLSKRLASAEAE